MLYILFPLSRFSRAIMCYLANQYGEDESIYPKDPKKRAVVDQRLNFDIGTLYLRFTNLYVSFIGLYYYINHLRNLKIHTYLYIYIYLLVNHEKKSYILVINEPFS